MNTLKGHFPSTKEKWKAYLKIFLPVIAGSMLFALNGVVDNFMVGHIKQGQAALGGINAWTAILTGFFIGTAAAGSVVMAQHYHAGNYEKVREIARLRFLLCLTAGILLAVIAWVSPSTLMDLFIHSKNPDLQYQANKYLKIIAIQWILISITFNLGNQIRELGYGKYTMMWGFGTLGVNIILNAILMHGVGMESDGAAWASVAGRIVAFTSGVAAIIYKKIPIGFKPWTIFIISKQMLKEFFKRWAYFLSLFTVTFFIIFRNHFYDIGFPYGVFGEGVSGLSVVSLTGSIMNIFTVSFSALATMAANFVGSELGKGHIKQARINANELKGFNTLMAASLSVIGCILAACMPFMNFLSNAKNTDNAEQLIQVSHAMFVIMIFYPMWIWFSTSYRIGNSGGRGHWFAFIDWVITGPIQIGWLAAITLGIVPHNSFMQHNFWVAYALFLSSDVLKLVFQEILYYKYDWAKSITKSDAEIKEIASRESLSKEASKNST